MSTSRARPEAAVGVSAQGLFAECRPPPTRPVSLLLGAPEEPLLSVDRGHRKVTGGLSHRASSCGPLLVIGALPPVPVL